MEKFRVTEPAAADDSFDDAPPPPPPPPPAEKRDIFGGLFRKKRGGGVAAAQEEGPTEEELALADERLAWLEEETERRREAHDRGVDNYVPREMPAHLQDDAYRAKRAEELENARFEHELEEKRRARELGDQYVPTPFAPGKTIVEGSGTSADPSAPPQQDASAQDGNLAEIFGEKAYGAGQINMNTSYMPGLHTPARTYDPAADVYGGAPAGFVNPAVKQVKKYGWAGIFDRDPNGPPPPPNPFTGPIVLPQTYPPAPVQNRAHEKGISYDVMQRMNEGRGLATLALNSHQSAPVLAQQGKSGEASAAYRAADAGYERALQLLMPARKMLEEGPESSRVVRAREKDRLEKLIAQILDRWEEVKPNLLPDLPSVPTKDSKSEVDNYHDPLLDRLAGGVAKMGPTGAPSQQASQTPPAALFSDTGELNLEALPSAPTHDVSLDGWEVPKSGGPKDCFVCKTPRSSKPAEVMTPCNCYLCMSCADSVFGLLNNCPNCNAPCRKDQLKAIA